MQTHFYASGIYHRYTPRSNAGDDRRILMVPSGKNDGSLTEHAVRAEIVPQ